MTDNGPELPEDGEGVYDGAEFVVYTAELKALDEYSEAERDELREWQKETGLNSLSLWARWDESEIPLFSANPSGSWFSLLSSQSRNVDADPLSDAFIEAHADPFEMTEEQYEGLTDAEKIISNSLRKGLVEMDPVPEQVEFIRWCERRVYDG